MSTQTTINDVPPKTQITATAGQTVFTTNWTANAASDIVVYARSSAQEPDDLTQEVNSTNYTVAFIGGSEIVEITFLVGRAAGDVITITRDTPADRLNLYTNTNFTASMLNQDIGVLTLVDQQAQLYNDQIAPHYNVSASIDLGNQISGLGGDIFLPVLGANQFWYKNASNTEIRAATLPSGGGQLPASLPLVTYTATPFLTNEANLGALPTGFLFSTVAAGISTISSVASTGSGNVVLNTGATLNQPKIGLTEVTSLATVARTATFQNASGTIAYLTDTNPVGTIIDYAGSSLPVGYLLCDGSEVAQATYPALYAVLGTLWGVAVNPANFVLPNFARKTAVGSGGVATPVLGNTVGSTGGSETHTLTVNELPAHSHPNVANTAGGSGLSGSGSIGTGSTGSTGGDQPHNIMQPSAVVLKCIKF